MIATIRSGFRCTSSSLDVELCFACSNKVIGAAGQLLANLQGRVSLDASSDGSAGSSVHQSTVLGRLNSFVFDPSRMSFVLVKVSVSDDIFRALNDVGFSALSGCGGLSKVGQVAGTAQNTLDRLVNHLRLMAVGS
jgi:hypothetical protein